MTPAGAALLRRIRATGPLTVADYMAECLAHPAHGYYATRDPLGAAGDFTTAPEISQMFGELIGLALARTWLDQGAPAPVTLAELGPGRGTLMADALRATRIVPGFHAALRLRLVEVSPALRARQAEALAGHAPGWCDGVGDLPDGPLLLVANEFFDALPIRQFVRDGAGWRERMVTAEGDRLVFALAPPAPVPALEAAPARPAGAVAETCPAAGAVAGEIGRRIAAAGGAAIVIDYGGRGGCGDTLQAVRAHRAADPLDAPGEADLTAHVDFAALAAAADAEGAAATGDIAQGVFLGRLGIAQRAARLAEAGGDAARAVAAAHARLTRPDQMGELFRAMAIHPSHSPPPPGFAA